jgi:hypothetical protein
MSEEIYKLKYLKYKHKYLQLKAKQDGGSTVIGNNPLRQLAHGLGYAALAAKRMTTGTAITITGQKDNQRKLIKEELRKIGEKFTNIKTMLKTKPVNMYKLKTELNIIKSNSSSDPKNKETTQSISHIIAYLDQMCKKLAPRIFESTLLDDCNPYFQI